jgi:hypothetical protein
MQRLTDVLKSQIARFALAYDAATMLANGAWRLVAAFTVTLYTLGIACAQLGPNLVTNGSFEPDRRPGGDPTQPRCAGQLSRVDVTQATWTRTAWYSYRLGLYRLTMGSSLWT